MTPELLRLSHFSAHIRQTQYFSDLSFSVREGEILGLAGLSPEQREILVQYFSGQLPSASGHLFAFGKPYAAASEPFPSGIFCIHRGSSLIAQMTITENLCILPSVRAHSLWINRRKLSASCQELIERFGLQIDCDTRAAELTPFGQIAVEFLKAVVSGAKVIFYNRGLDELTDREFAHLQTLFLSLTAAGISIVALCGQPARMLQVSSRIVAVKNGTLIKSLEHSNAREIRRTTLGSYARQAAQLPDRSAQEAPLLSIRGLRLSAGDHPLDLTVHRGEIIGLVDDSFSGAGRVLQALYGLIPCSCTHYSLNGRILPTNRPDRAFALGMLLIQRIESTDLLLPGAPLKNSIALPLLQRSAGFAGIIRRQFLELELASAAGAVGLLPEDLNRPLTPELVLRAQLARILVSHRSILLLENPFAGLSPADDHRLRQFIVDYANAGGCVLLSFTHFSEISEICTSCYQLVSGDLIRQQSP